MGRANPRNDFVYVVLTRAELTNQRINLSTSTSPHGIRFNRQKNKAILKVRKPAPGPFLQFRLYSLDEILEILKDPEWDIPEKEILSYRFKRIFSKKERDARDAYISKNRRPPREGGQGGSG